MKLFQVSVLLTAAVLTVLVLQSCVNVAHAIPGMGMSVGGIAFRGGVDAGIGSMKNESNSIPSRTMNEVALYAMPGYQFAMVTGGVLAEYRVRGQNTEASTVGNQNLSGGGYLVGPALGFSFLSFHLIGSFDLLGQYKMANVTSTGAESTYKSVSGFRFMLGYSLFPMISVNATYQMASYGKNTTGSTETDLSSNKVKESMMRAGVSFSF